MLLLVGRPSRQSTTPSPQLIQFNPHAPHRTRIANKPIQQIKAESQGPLYAHICEKLGWTPDAALVAELTAANEAELAKLDEQLQVRRS